MIKRKVGEIIVFFAIIIVMGCHSGGPDYSPYNVKREDPHKEVIAGYKWNDTDYKLVADHMYNSLLSSDFYRKHSGKKITIMTGTIDNRTLEHIDIKVLTDSIATKLIRSGTFNVVDGSAREELKKEYEYHRGPYIDPSTQKKEGKQIGEDFLLRGTIYSSIEDSRYLKVVYYKVTLQLTDIQTNLIVWQDEFDIKKIVKKIGY
ncbi:MAG: penicillin-binding protein activator LpoB [Planctomycetota bacterium]